MIEWRGGTGTAKGGQRLRAIGGAGIVEGNQTGGGPIMDGTANLVYVLAAPGRLTW